MTRFKVYEADVWGDCNNYDINMFYPLIEIYTGKQLIIDLDDDLTDDDIINTLINNQIIDYNILNQDDYSIDIDYMYSDIIITIYDNNNEILPTIIKLEEV